MAQRVRLHSPVARGAESRRTGRASAGPAMAPRHLRRGVGRSVAMHEAREAGPTTAVHRLLPRLAPPLTLTDSAADTLPRRFRSRVRNRGAADCLRQHTCAHAPALSHRSAGPAQFDLHYRQTLSALRTRLSREPPRPAGAAPLARAS